MSWFDCLYSTQNLQKHQSFHSRTIEVWNLISIFVFLLPAWIFLVYEAFVNSFWIKYGQRQGQTNPKVQAWGNVQDVRCHDSCCCFVNFNTLIFLTVMEHLSIVWFSPTSVVSIALTFCFCFACNKQEWCGRSTMLPTKCKGKHVRCCSCLCLPPLPLCVHQCGHWWRPLASIYEVVDGASGPICPFPSVRLLIPFLLCVSQALTDFALFVCMCWRRPTWDHLINELDWSSDHRIAAHAFESTVRQAQRGQEIALHGLHEAQARRMVPGGAERAGARAEGAGRRVGAAGAECGRGRSARGWCQHFGFHVGIGLVNVFRPDFARETAGSTGGRAGRYPLIIIGTLGTAGSGPYRAAFDSGQHWESNRADARPSGQDPAGPDFGPDLHVCHDVA